MTRVTLSLLILLALAIAPQRASAYGFGGLTRANSGLFSGSQPMMPDAMNRGTDSMGRPVASASRSFLDPPQGGPSYQPAPSQSLLFPPDGGFGGT